MVSSMKDKKLIINIKSCFKSEHTLKNGIYSFMNPASLSAFYFSREDSEISYYCDSKLMSVLVSLLSGRKVKRVSFDYTSIASFIFENSIVSNKKIYFIGAESEEIDIFIQKIKNKHPGIIICGYRNGYFTEDATPAIYQQIILTKPDIVIAGLGAGKQEKFIKGLRKAGCNSNFYTCGGFIRQESTTVNDYYPTFINDFGMRGFYRMVKEPHTIKRYLIDYPVNIVKFIFLFYTKNIELNVD